MHNKLSKAGQAARSGAPARLTILSMTEIAITTAQREDGMVALIGQSGLGKTFSAQFLLARFNAHYLRASVHWTPKSFLAALLYDLGEEVRPENFTVSTLMNRARERLARWPGPIIIDEADMLFDLSGKATESAQKKVETVRELFDATGLPIVLIGEEHLDSKTRKWERFHSRIVEWVKAPLADATDARLLADAYAPGLAVADDLVEHIRARTQGSVRRIKQNVLKAARKAIEQGATCIDLDWWQSMGLIVTTGDVARTRGDAA